MIMGLPWEVFDARFITSTGLLLCSLVLSSWMRDEFNRSRCLCLAFSNLLCASATSFDRCSKSMFVFVVRFVGAAPFFVGCRFSCGRVFFVGFAGLAIECLCRAGLVGWLDGPGLESAGGCLCWACLFCFFSVNRNSFISS